MEDFVTIDGSYGEGGGQILRSALTLSMITGRSLQVQRIRAGRRKPGLQPQHLAGVKAAASICRAQVEGAALGSQELSFSPGPAVPGDYAFDVAEERGSAGAVALVLQAILLPLALATKTPALDRDHQKMARSHSRLRLCGGTHVPLSPSFHYLKLVFLPTLARLGVQADTILKRWGWYPKGGGLINVRVPAGQPRPTAADWRRRGELVSLKGVSAVSNLSISIAERQRSRAESLLRERGFAPEFEIVSASSAGPGTLLFLSAEYENALAGFTGLGERGKPAEKVAEEACHEFFAHHATDGALDSHLADQIILPLSLAQGASAFTTSRITRHLLTNIWVVAQFLPVRCQVEGLEGEPGTVSIVPGG